MEEACANSKKIMVSFSNSFCLLEFILTFVYVILEGYYLDHAIGTEDQEEESVDRLWLVARSLKNEQGKYDYKI